jgi:hypothetical protein
MGLGSLEAIYDNVQPQVPGATTDMVVMATWNTIYDFYISSTLRREHVFWCMEPGVNCIDFNPWDKNWDVFRFLEFRGLSRPKFEPPSRLRDVQHPVADNVRNGEALLALAPHTLNTPLGDEFWALWFDPVVSGVLGRLYMQGGKPYSDANLARINLGMYRNGVNQARAHAQSGFVTDGVPWVYPYFATGRPKNGGWGG